MMKLLPSYLLLLLHVLVGCDLVSSFACRRMTRKKQKNQHPTHHTTLTKPFFMATSSSSPRRDYSYHSFLSRRLELRQSTSNDDQETTSATTNTAATTAHREDSDAIASTIVASCNATVVFPSYAQLMMCQPGQFVTSQLFTVVVPHPKDDPKDESPRSYDFVVKLYPRGGGHKASYNVMSISANEDNRKRPNGFFSWLTPKSDPLKEKVGIYLQYLPKDDNALPVDATFALRLKGRQAQGPRFDVEWRAGMRLVPLAASQLAAGQANDFGAHLMRTVFLDDFLGVVEKDYNDYMYNDELVQGQVEIYIHQRPPQTSTTSRDATTLSSSDNETKSGIALGLKALNIPDLRNNPNDNNDPLRTGQVVVPVLRRLSQRPRMFALGAYPGVEFRILRMINPQTQEDVCYHQPGVDYELKPIYPLVRQLERPWPVRVTESDIPKLITAAQYNTISAVGSLLTAATGLTAAFLLSQMISVFFIPSRSMEPTLQVGDVLLVEKVTPRLFPKSILHEGQVVLFHPPSKLQEIVARSGGRVSDRDLFVKRIAATTPGSTLQVTQSGDVQINGVPPVGRRDLCTAEPLRLIERYISPGEKVIPPGQVAVLGDCASVSVDSRVWGGLPQADIVGRPLFRVWPLQRFGPIVELPTTQSELWSD